MENKNASDPLTCVSPTYVVSTAPGSLTLTASASSAGSAIASVAFYAGATLIGTATAAPYTYTWSGIAAGTYSITAVVTDIYNVSTTSAALSVTVNNATVQAYYIHTDQLATPRVITDTAGNVVWQWDNSDPFGNNITNENPAGAGTFNFNLRFPGQYYDRETNLHYNVNRDYDPAIGRYIESDPIGLDGGVNTYSYAQNNPLSNFDSTGLEVNLVCRPLAGLLGATGKQHCFVSVSCPAEGWSRTLSLFPTGIFSGRKSLSTPDTPNSRDNPDAPGNTSTPITPSKPGCDKCAYEKDVMNRFFAFPSGEVPYFLLGPNSNTFANWLITSPAFGASSPGGQANAPGFGLFGAH